MEDERHVDTIFDVALKSCLWTQLLSLSIGFASSFMYKLLDNINGLTTIYKNVIQVNTDINLRWIVNLMYVNLIY